MIHVLRSYVWWGHWSRSRRGLPPSWLGRATDAVDTRRQQLGLVAHLSRWMAAGGLDVAELAPQVVERYVDARRAADYRQFRSVRAGAVAGLSARVGGAHRYGAAIGEYHECGSAATVPGSICSTSARWGRRARVAMSIWSLPSSRSAFETAGICGLLLPPRLRRFWSASRAGCRRRRCSAQRPRCGRCCGSGMCRG